MKTVITMFTLFMLISQITFAQDSLNVVKLSEFYYWDYIVDVAISGNYAYVLDCNCDIDVEQFSLRVVDISDPCHPIEVGFCENEGGYDICISGNYAYVCYHVWIPHGNISYFKIFDVNDPTHPVLVSQFNTNYSAGDITVIGNYAYVADGVGLGVFDINDPTNPIEISYCYTPQYALGVAVSGNYAYIADNNSIQIIDISNAANPFIVGYCYTQERAENIAISDNYAYVVGNDGNGGGGFSIIDINDPSTPLEVGFLGVTGFRVTIDGNNAYIADGEFGLRVLDISDPENPTEVGNYNTPYYAVSVSLTDNYVFVADGEMGLRVIDINLPSNPFEVGWYCTPWNNRNIAVSGNYAFLTGRLSLFVMDISDPLYPHSVDYYQLETTYWFPFTLNIEISGNYAYIAAYSDDLRIVDISNPENICEVGYCNLPGDTMDLVISGEYVFSVGYLSLPRDLYVTDISDPYNPYQVGMCSTPEKPYGVDINDDYAYVADNNYGLRVIDISNPEQPFEVSQLTGLGYVKDIAVLDYHAFLISYYPCNVLVVDISDPNSPLLVASCDIPGLGHSITISGNHAFIANSDGLWIINISDPNNPYEVGYYITSGYAYEVAVVSDYVYLADCYNFSIYDCSEAIQVGINDNVIVHTPDVLLTQNYPNPFNPETTISYQLTAVSKVSLAVYNVKGQLVNTLVNEIKPAGEHSIIWNGTDQSKQSVPSGVYLYRLKTKDDSKIKKMILLR
ncbi:MAG: T9SS type A sorting domain-containing protein [Candidatus Cloacimonetes bacterium]|nr:T9SS type A sorting domain-containing protein [Candidatus Cloacimonadota bacterium]